MEAYVGFTRIYTDGSKSNEAVACAAICGQTVQSCRLPDGASVFSAEMRAIQIALQMIRNSSDRQFVILSDSLSCLQSIRNVNWMHPMVREVLTAIHQLKVAGKSVVMFWLPSHIGIPGNTRADDAAKAALALPQSKVLIPYSDFKPMIASHIIRQWQVIWDQETNNKLHAISPAVNSTRPLLNKSRHDEVVLHRARIGHTHITHAYLLNREAPPVCALCQCPLTVEHILVTCVAFTLVRSKLYTVTSLFELFETVPAFKILLFLKEIGLYTKF
jgi:kelch-like protein 2/3